MRTTRTGEILLLYTANAASSHHILDNAYAIIVTELTSKVENGGDIAHNSGPTYPTITLFTGPEHRQNVEAQMSKNVKKVT